MGDDPLRHGPDKTAKTVVPGEFIHVTGIVKID
jgi:hypothetical protein